MTTRRLIAALLLMLALPLTAQAGEGDLAFTLDCGGFESAGGTLALNRDNTGTQSEAFVISAIDGGGNIILEPIYDVFFVGTSITFEAGAGEAWTRGPRYNPLILQVSSPAGNGLEEQVIAEYVGTCPGLPRFGPIDVLASFGRDAVRQLTGEAFVILPADGETSDPIEINEVPPRPVNPDGLAKRQLGFAVVNTDNLNLRNGDGPRYEVIGVVDGGTELVVLGRNTDRSWWYVQVGGLRGWVSSEFLILRGDLTGVPIVPVEGSLTPARMYVGFTGTPALALPEVGTATVCALPGNLEYEVVGRTTRSTWYQIAFVCDGVETEGWLQAEQGIVRNPANVPIPVVLP